MRIPVPLLALVFAVAAAPACAGGAGPNPLAFSDDGGAEPSDGGAAMTDGPDLSAPTAEEPPELAGITAAHNQARAAEGASLPPLVWDAALAAIAQGWASQCKSANGALIDHNAGRSDGYGSYVGENIYASTGGATGAAAVSSWMSEKKNYDLAKNSCSGTCGHYTQVVWKKTTRLGCALANCPNLKFPSTIVCDYAPGGNMNGERPY